MQDKLKKLGEAMQFITASVKSSRKGMRPNIDLAFENVKSNLNSCAVCGNQMRRYE